uniref:Uncharacterized protein n=1 Tax=Ascaris lumbricoides TaxID=6252 RepID=A0A0M3HFX2_ASCLU
LNDENVIIYALFSTSDVDVLSLTIVVNRFFCCNANLSAQLIHIKLSIRTFFKKITNEKNLLENFSYFNISSEVLFLSHLINERN